MHILDKMERLITYQPPPMFIYAAIFLTLKGLTEKLKGINIYVDVNTAINRKFVAPCYIPTLRYSVQQSNPSYWIKC